MSGRGLRLILYIRDVHIHTLQGKLARPLNAAQLAATNDVTLFSHYIDSHGPLICAPPARFVSFNKKPADFSGGFF